MHNLACLLSHFAVNTNTAKMEQISPCFLRTGGDDQMLGLQWPFTDRRCIFGIGHVLDFLEVIV